jgi:dihydrofolate synthase / folylpolyglutamate synthase
MVRMPHWPNPLWHKIIFGLDRIESLMQKLDNPHLKLPPIIHVAGTNGKGSTVAFLRSIFENAGYKVHAYISPHLVNFNERIILAGKEITDEELYYCLEECRYACESLPHYTTFFEGTTAAAFLAFSRHKADILIMETGMGGRFDATNIVPSVLANIITPISYDHMEYLGEKLEQIAFEKSGIIKKDAEVIISLQEDEALEVIENKAYELGCNTTSFGFDYYTDNIANGVYDFVMKDGVKIENLKPSLYGDHQIINSSGAVAAAIQIKKHFPLINEEAIRTGLANAKWPARLQQLTSGKIFDLLPEGFEIYIDGAHNLSGAHVVSMWMDEHNDKPLYMISGLTRNRKGEVFYPPFVGKVKKLYGVVVDAEPSSHKAEYIASSALSVGIDAVASESIENAILDIVKNASEPSIIIFCGSLFLAAQVLEANMTAPNQKLI